MGRVIILEGPDGAGKTTLAHYLRDNAGFEYLHTGPPDAGTDLLVSYASVLDAAIRSGKNIVIDRLHVGESVYGPLLRKVDRIGPVGQVILQRIIRGAGVLEVFCLPPYKVCYGNWFRRRQERGELVTDSNTFEQIYRSYERAFKSNLHAYARHYDYSRVSLEMACAMLLSEMNKLPALPEGCIGSPSASFLFVGEKANQETLDLPWVALGNSSQYLFDALHDAGYVEEEMAFTNARKLDGTRRDLHDIVFDMVMQGKEEPQRKQPVLIGLGGIATKDLDFFGYRTCRKSVPHPAFWKRFHNRDRDDYVRKLKDIRIERYAQVR